MLRYASGGEGADHHGKDIDYQVHTGPDLGARCAVVIHQQVLEFEIRKGADKGIKKDEQADHQQVAALQELAEAG